MNFKLYLAIGFFLLIVGSSLVSAQVPYVVRNTIVTNSSSNTQGFILQPISGDNGDVAIVTIGGSSSASVAIDSVSPGFSFFGASGTTRRTEIWGYQSLDTETVNPVISDNANWSQLAAHGFLVRGADDEFNAQTITTTQASANNWTKNITTLRNNSLIVAIIFKANTNALNYTDGDLINHTQQGTGTFTTITKNASVAGFYTIGAAWNTSILSSIFVMEIASESNGTTAPSGTFNATNITSNNLGNFSNALYDSDLANILWMGDSVSTPPGQSVQRWPAAFMKTFNHSGGWASFTTGGGVSNGFVTRSISATIGGNTSYNDYITTDDFWQDASFFGSLWFGRDMVWKLGGDYAPDANGNLMTWTASTTPFNTAVIPDWFTPNRLSAQLGYLYDNNIVYVTNFTLKNSTSIYQTFNLTDTSEIVGGAVQNRRLNLLTDKVPLGSSRALTVGNVSGATDRFIDFAMIKINNDNNTNGVAFASLGESSTSYTNFYGNTSPTSTLKHYPNPDLSLYLQHVYNGRTNGDNFVFIAMGAEGGTVEEQVTKLHLLVGNLTRVYTEAGMNPPRIMLVSTYRTFDDNESKVQAEVFYNMSTVYQNVSFINLYALTQGILLNGTNPLQNTWAEQNNYSDILVNNGTHINVSGLQLIDASSGVHQNSETAAFFFSYLMNNELENGVTNQSNPGGNNSTAVYVCSTGDQATISLILVIGALLILAPLVFIFVSSGGDIWAMFQEINIKTLLVVFIVISVGTAMLVASAQSLGAVCGT